MRPPQHILDALHRIHPWARIGWYGEGDKGKFSLLQLYHNRDSYCTIVQRWDNRGPVYGKPYDLLARTPMWLADFSIQDVVSGKILKHVEAWLKPMSERVRESEDRAWKDLDFRLNDLAEEGGDYVWHQSRQTGHGSDNTARKFVSKEQQAILAGDYDRSAGNVVHTPKPEGAVAMK
jgi:hypothetical protein